MMNKSFCSHGAYIPVQVGNEQIKIEQIYNVADGSNCSEEKQSRVKEQSEIGKSYSKYV